MRAFSPSNPPKVCELQLLHCGTASAAAGFQLELMIQVERFKFALRAAAPGPGGVLEGVRSVHAATYTVDGHWWSLGSASEHRGYWCVELPR